MNEEILNQYARLVVRTGVNVQPGQPVSITADVGDAYFALKVVKEAYEAGASQVRVEWENQELTCLHYAYQSTETLCEFLPWHEEKLKWAVETLPAMIYIDSEDPDGLNSIDPEKLMTVRRTRGPLIKKYRDMMENKYQWTIVGIPGKAWARKVFPELSEQEAFDALWDAILDVTRAKGDAVENWRIHNENLKEKSGKLNSLGVRTLHYRSETTGTDFSVSIDPRMNFVAGGEYTLGGVYYQPNMPTEECFTSPDRFSANGVVMATKPLSLYGKLVDDFGFRFENGKVVEVIAAEPDHKNALEQLIATDEGASMLGEVALVPFDSPINQTGLLFYNTLYDENACCHLALGRGFTDCIRDFAKLSEEEIKAVGINDSVIHIDFMIGSADLLIEADTQDGNRVTIFRDGTWAI